MYLNHNKYFLRDTSSEKKPHIFRLFNGIGTESFQVTYYLAQFEFSLAYTGDQKTGTVKNIASMHIFHILPIN